MTMSDFVTGLRTPTKAKGKAFAVGAVFSFAAMVGVGAYDGIEEGLMTKDAVEANPKFTEAFNQCVTNKVARRMISHSSDAAAMLKNGQDISGEDIGLSQNDFHTRILPDCEQETLDDVGLRETIYRDTTTSRNASLMLGVFALAALGSFVGMGWVHFHGPQAGENRDDAPNGP